MSNSHRIPQVEDSSMDNARAHFSTTFATSYWVFSLYERAKYVSTSNPIHRMGLHFSIRMAEHHTWKTTVASPCDALRPTKSHVQRFTMHGKLSGVLVASFFFRRLRSSCHMFLVLRRDADGPPIVGFANIRIAFAGPEVSGPHVPSDRHPLRIPTDI